MERPVITSLLDGNGRVGEHDLPPKIWLINTPEILRKVHTMMGNDGYLQFVQQEAKKIGKVFILDTGEGNDFEDPVTGWYIEDLSGWLIDGSLREQFLIDLEEGKHWDTFDESYVFVEWNIKDNSEIEIKFVKYPSYE
ncbi:hypothetical protein JOD24_003276 [Kroppenstedtia sanguinis]